MDIHVHMGTSSIYGYNQLPVEDYLKLMRRYRIRKAIVSGFTPEDLNFEKMNVEVGKLLAAHPKEFVGAVFVDPRTKDKSIGILKAMLKLPSFVAIILNPYEQSFKANDLRFLSPVMEQAEHFNVPVIVESGYPMVSTPLQIGELARAYPKVPIVMTHAGQLLASGQSESDALAAMIENDNVYPETSQIILTGIGGFIQQVSSSSSSKNRITENTDRERKKIAPIDRILFGSDSPLCDLGVELERVLVSEISDEEKKKILHHNAVSLFAL